MADRGRPVPIGAAIYASAHKAVQPPDDRTYSAEVTAIRRNLPHHRSARAVFPRTRLIMIPPEKGFVKKNFRENHKDCMNFSYNLRHTFFNGVGFKFSCRGESLTRPSASAVSWQSRFADGRGNDPPLLSWHYHGQSFSAFQISSHWASVVPSALMFTRAE